MSYLLVKEKNMSKLKIQESEILESMHSLRTKIFKSDLGNQNKMVIDKSMQILEDSIRDYFALEFYNTKKVGNS